jgi:hypothetical protein
MPIAEVARQLGVHLETSATGGAKRETLAAWSP